MRTQRLEDESSARLGKESTIAVKFVGRTGHMGQTQLENGRAASCGGRLLRRAHRYVIAALQLWQNYAALEASLDTYRLS